MERDIQEEDHEPLEAGGVSRALREVMWANAEANQGLARRLGLGINDVVALDHLLQDKPLGPAELGQRLGIKSASATALVDRLEAAGHVERRPHPTDRRRLTIEPTQHALREILGVLSPLLDDLESVTGELSPEEQLVVMRYLSRVTEVLHDYGSGNPEV